MQILPDRNIENDVYSTVIKPTEFGTETVTASDEIEMLKDTPQILRYADIDFKDKFVITNKIPTISSDPSAVEVSLNLNNKEFTLDENFKVSLSVDANKIVDAELDGTVFTDKHDLAMAKVILFETKVIAQIKKLLDVARSHVTTFEDTVEQIL